MTTLALSRDNRIVVKEDEGTRQVEPLMLRDGQDRPVSLTKRGLVRFTSTPTILAAVRMSPEEWAESYGEKLSPGLTPLAVYQDSLPTRAELRMLWDTFFSKYAQEAVVLWGHRRVRGEGGKTVRTYMIPEQVGTTCDVEHDDPIAAAELGVVARYAGSIHSHPGSGTVRSGIDLADWRQTSGTHLILGRDRTFRVYAALREEAEEIAQGSFAGAEFGAADQRPTVMRSGGNPLEKLMKEPQLWLPGNRPWVREEEDGPEWWREGEPIGFRRPGPGAKQGKGKWKRWQKWLEQRGTPARRAVAATVGFRMSEVVVLRGGAWMSTEAKVSFGEVDWGMTRQVRRAIGGVLCPRSR